MMAKKLTRLLKTDIMTNDLSVLAEMLRSKGRGKDTMLAHITPEEAQLLKDRGGSGTINPDTGLPEFDDSFNIDYNLYQQPVDTASLSTPSTYTPASSYSDQSSSSWQPANMTTYYQQPVDVAPSAAPYLGYESYTPASQYSPQNIGTTYTPSVSPDFQTPGTTGVATTPAAMGATGMPSTADTLTQGGAAIPPEIAAQMQKDMYGTGTQAPAGKPDQAWYQKLFGSPFSEQMLRLGLTGALGLYGSSQAKKGAQQAQAATAQQQQIAHPYQQQGQAMISAASRGELTPQSAQSYQAMQAQLQQGVANRGGVGAAQATAQLEAFRQQLLNNQYTYGIQVAQIGDNIALGAIRTGLQLDQQMQQATQGFYTNLAAIAGGTLLPGQPTGRGVGAPSTP